MYLDLKKPWPGPKGILEPGTYGIPDEIEQIHACCAAADGAGVIEKDMVEEQDEARDEGHDNPEEEDDYRKGPAPENKLQPAPPSNKTGLGRATGRRRRSRSKSGEDAA